MSDEYEDQIAEFESAMADAAQKWFEPRQKYINRDYANERIFEGGFRMAWNTRAQHKQPSDEEAVKDAIEKLARVSGESVQAIALHMVGFLFDEEEAGNIINSTR